MGGGSGGSGSGGRSGSGAGSGDSGQPGEVFRQAEEAKFRELDKMAATITSNITSGKMTLDQANAAHEALSAQAAKATGAEKNALTLKATVMKAGIEDAKFAIREKRYNKAKFGVH